MRGPLLIMLLAAGLTAAACSKSDQKQVSSDVKAAGQDLGDAARNTMQNAKDSDTLADAKASAQDAAHDAKTAVQEGAAQTKAAAQDAGQQVSDAAKQAAADARQSAHDLKEKSQKP